MSKYEIRIARNHEQYATVIVEADCQDDAENIASEMNEQFIPWEKIDLDMGTGLEVIDIDDAASDSVVTVMPEEPDPTKGDTLSVDDMLKSLGD